MRKIELACNYWLQSIVNFEYRGIQPNIQIMRYKRHRTQRVKYQSIVALFVAFKVPFWVRRDASGSTEMKFFYLDKLLLGNKIYNTAKHMLQ